MSYTRSGALGRHTPGSQTIYAASTLGVDPNRTMVNSSVSLSDTGHIYGADLCPDTTGLNPIADRKEIETR